ncbi:MAG: cation diffusion facilitator family transporter [Thermodesulfobacteriota bacterium]
MTPHHRPCSNAPQSCGEMNEPHSHGDHGHPPRGLMAGANTRGARLLITLAINFVIPVAQIIGGILSNSIALISDAVHNFSDFAAVFISYVAYRISRKGVSTRHTFGFQRAEILGALLNVVILTCAVVYILYEAINRFFQPEAVSGGVVMILAGVGIIGNGFSAWLLHRDASHNLNVRGAFLHMMGDFLTSVVVLVNGAILMFKPWYWLDPLLSVLIAAFILKNGWTVVKESVGILMNATPRHLDLEAVQNVLEARPEIHSAHYLHVWQVGSCGVAFTCHLTVDDQNVSQTEALAADLRKLLYEKFGIDHPVFQFETSVCGNATLLCEISDAENPGGPSMAAGSPETNHQGPKQGQNPGRFSFGRLLEAGLRVLVGGIFIYAAVPKIIDPAAFAETVLNYQILPEVLINPVAIFLPWLELITGVLILSGLWLEGALVIYNLLMLTFIGILIYNTARGLDIHCGCFSTSGTEVINLDTILRDSLILIPSAYLLYRVFTRSAGNSEARSNRPADTA